MTTPHKRPPPAAPKRNRASLSASAGHSPGIEPIRIAVEEPTLTHLVLPDGSVPMRSDIYDVVFRQRVCGMELIPGEDSRNAIVGQLLSTTAKAHVISGSTVIAVDRMGVANWPYTEILNRIANVPRPLKVTFQRPRAAPPLTPISQAVQRVMTSSSGPEYDLDNDPWGHAHQHSTRKRRSHKLGEAKPHGDAEARPKRRKGDLAGALDSRIEQATRDELIETIGQLRKYIRDNSGSTSASSSSSHHKTSDHDELSARYQALWNDHQEILARERNFQDALTFKVEEMAELRAENERLRSDLVDKENRIQELNVQNAITLTQGAADMEDYKRKLDQVGEAFDEAMKEKRTLAEANKTLRRENVSLRSKIEALEVVKSHDASRLSMFSSRAPANANAPAAQPTESTSSNRIAQSAARLVGSKRASSGRMMALANRTTSNELEPGKSNSEPRSSPRKIFRRFFGSEDQTEDTKTNSNSDSRRPPATRPPNPPSSNPRGGVPSLIRQLSNESNSEEKAPPPPSPSRKRFNQFTSAVSLFESKIKNGNHREDSGSSSHSASNPPSLSSLSSTVPTGPPPVPTKTKKPAGSSKTAAIRAQLEARGGVRPHVQINVTPAITQPHRPRGNAVKQLSARFESNLKRRSSSFSAPSTNRRAQTESGMV